MNSNLEKLRDLLRSTNLSSLANLSNSSVTVPTATIFKVVAVVAVAVFLLYGVVTLTDSVSGAWFNHKEAKVEKVIVADDKVEATAEAKANADLSTIEPIQAEIKRNDEQLSHINDSLANATATSKARARDRDRVRNSPPRSGDVKLSDLDSKLGNLTNR